MPLQCPIAVIRDNSPKWFTTGGTTHHNTSGLTNGDLRKATRGTPRTGKMLRRASQSVWWPGQNFRSIHGKR